jgi:hypothetical protein
VYSLIMNLDNIAEVVFANKSVSHQ